MNHRERGKILFDALDRLQDIAERIAANAIRIGAPPDGLYVFFSTNPDGTLNMNPEQRWKNLTPDQVENLVRALAKIKP